LAARAQLFDGVICTDRRLRHCFHDLLLYLLVDRQEEAMLVAEVMLQRATGHAGGRHDVLARGPGVPPLREQRSCGCDESSLGRTRTLCLRPRVTYLTLDHACRLHVSYLTNADK